MSDLIAVLDCDNLHGTIYVRRRGEQIIFSGYPDGPSMWAGEGVTIGCEPEPGEDAEHENAVKHAMDAHPDEEHCACAAVLRAEVARLRNALDEARGLLHRWLTDPGSNAQGRTLARETTEHLKGAEWWNWQTPGI